MHEGTRQSAGLQASKWNQAKVLFDSTYTRNRPRLADLHPRVAGQYIYTRKNHP
jgi:hypothetical protein